MHVTFKRTGPRRYAVIVTCPGQEPRSMDPAPGYDDDIPHDVVHYVVEAELKLTSGVFGRAARGAGTFIASAGPPQSARDRMRQRRKQLRREAHLHERDQAGGHEMASSERLAALCDLAWRRRHGQRADPLKQAPEAPHGRDDAARIDRVVARLDTVAPLWRKVPVGGALVFEWPSATPYPVGAEEPRSSRAEEL